MQPGLSVLGTQFFSSVQDIDFQNVSVPPFKCFEILKFFMGVRVGINVMKAGTINAIVFMLHQ
jgi:hypothetical protein